MLDTCVLKWLYSGSEEWASSIDYNPLGLTILYSVTISQGVRPDFMRSNGSYSIARTQERYDHESMAIILL